MGKVAITPDIDGYMAFWGWRINLLLFLLSVLCGGVLAIAVELLAMLRRGR